MMLFCAAAHRTISMTNEPWRGRPAAVRGSADRRVYRERKNSQGVAPAPLQHKIRIRVQQTTRLLHRYPNSNNCKQITEITPQNESGERQNHATAVVAPTNKHTTHGRSTLGKGPSSHSQDPISAWSVEVTPRPSTGVSLAKHRNSYWWYQQV